MNHLASLLPLDCVRIDVDALSRKRVFEEASLIFERSSGVPHTEAFDALFAREKIGSTCLGHGCGIPHGRLADIDVLSLAFLRTREPVALDAGDNEPVNVFLCLLIPEKDEGDYLTVLREIAGLLSDEHARGFLKTSPSEEAICRFIHDWEPPAPPEPEEDGGASGNEDPTN